MAYQFTNFAIRAKEINEWLAREFSGLRTGRATPAILDSVFVDSYGAKSLIRNIATISLEDTKTLRILPFDTSIAKEIEKAIILAGLGLSVSLDDRGVRARFPDLTSESRLALMKVAKEKIENARINLRKLRDEIIKDIEQKEKAGSIGKDEKFRLKKEFDKMCDAENKKFQDIFERKEKEISG